MKYFPFFLVVLLVYAIPVFSQNDIKTIRKNAEELSDQRKYIEAAAEISKAIELQPNDAFLVLERAEYFWLAKKNEALLNDVQTAVSINPTDKKVLYAGAQFLLRSGNNEQALKICNELFALGEPDYWAWQLIVQIKTNLEDFVGAFEDVSKAIELFPEDTRFRQNQAYIINSLGNSQKAIELFTSLISSYEKKVITEKDENKKERFRNDVSQFLFNRSRIYFETYRRELAQNDLSRAVENLPTVQIYYQRARHYIMFKMPAEALPDLNKAIEIGDKDTGFRFFLDRGDIYFGMRKYAEAIEDYEQVAKLMHVLKENMQKRISLARTKMQEIDNQPK